MKRAKVACLCLCSGECFNIQFVGKLKKSVLCIFVYCWCSVFERMLRAVYLKAFCIPLIFQVFFPASLADYLRPFHFLFSYRSHLKKYGMCSKTRPNWTGISRVYNSKKLLLLSIFELDISETKKPSLFSQSNKSLCFVQKLAKCVWPTILLLLTQFVVHFSWPFFTDYSVPFWPGKKVLQVRK